MFQAGSVGISSKFFLAFKITFQFTQSIEKILTDVELFFEIKMVSD